MNPDTTPGTLQQLLARAARAPSAGLRFVDRQERERFLAWSEIAGRAAGVAGALAAAGVAPGERVALVYPTSPDFFFAFFGALLAAAVPVPLYPPLRLGRVADYTERTAARLAAAQAAVVLAAPSLRALLAPAAAAARPRLGLVALEDLAAEAPPLARGGSPDDLALVQFSSGTTAQPKPVALEQRAVLAQVRALNALWPDTPERRQSGVSWLPLYHDMGLIGCALPALERPGTLTLLAPEDFVARPALWLRAISRHRATISAAPDFAYALAAERVRDDELAGVDLSSWRHALDGAETVVPAVLRRFAARFAPYGFRAEALTPVYGLSEAALAVTFGEVEAPFRSAVFERETLARDGVARRASAGREIASVGRPLAGFALEIRDAALGARLDPGRVGRVFVRGPSLFRGYLGAPALTREVLAPGGWLDTGDLGFLEDGELYLVGRAKDVILQRGRKHAPEDLEQAAAVALDGARAAALAAVSHLAAGEERERVLLFAEVRSGAARERRDTIAAELRAGVLAATGVAVDDVILLAPGALPRTSSGKVRRQETLRLHLAGELAAAEAPAPAKAETQ